MRNRVAAAVVGLVIVSGCSGNHSAAPSSTASASSTAAASSLVAGYQRRTGSFGGIERSWGVDVPASGPPYAGVVVALHGGGGSGEQARASYHLDRLADEHGYVVVTPDGTTRPGAGDAALRVWNAGTCCGAAAGVVDDVGFLTSIATETAAEAGVGSDHVFVTGMSNGGMMALRLACESDVFAAVATVAGSLVTDCTAPHGSLLMIHGLVDSNVPFDGGVGDGIGHPDVAPVPTVAALFAAANSCSDPADSRDEHVVTEEWPCPAGRVVLMTIDDAGHSWPGGEGHELRGDPPSEHLDATAEIGDFFDSLVH